VSKSVKLEALIAWPPTSKCRETIEVLEEVVRRHPDAVRLVVFKRGTREFPEQPGPSMLTLMHKGSTVPACLVNGRFFSSCQVPKLEELEAKVQEALGAG
jgi:hypothetical protein